MKKIICLTVAFVLCMVFCVSYAESSIYTQNFDELGIADNTQISTDIAAGASNGANPVVSSKYAYSGTYSMKVHFKSNSTATSGLGAKLLLTDTQKAALVDGTEYIIKAKVYYESLENNSVSIDLQTMNKAKVSQSRTNVTKGSWQDIQLIFVYEASSHPDDFYFRFVSASTVIPTDCYYVDDVVIEKNVQKSYFASKSANFDDIDELVSNVDFSNNDSKSTISISKEMDHTLGTGKSMKVTGAESTSGRICLMDFFEESELGSTCYVRLYIYPLTDGSFRIGIKGDTNSNSYWGANQFFEVTANKWNEIIIQVEVVEKSTSSATKITNHIAIVQNGGPIDTFYIDDVSLYTPTLEPAQYFADHAVFQRNKPIPVWGTHTNKDATITVVFDGETKQTNVNEDGTWKVEFDAKDVKTDVEMSISDGEITYEYKDIAIGELILCAGQSNMQIKVYATEDYEKMLEICESYDIRFFEQDNAESFDEQLDVTNGRWILSSKQNLQYISALPYYTAYFLHDYLENVPIGLVDMAYGGTKIQTWVSEDIVRNNDMFNGIEKQLDNAIESGQIDRNTPSACYNAMFYPMRHLPVKSIIWYQGASDVAGDVYSAMFDELVKMWRENYNDEDMVVIVTQQTPNDGKSPGMRMNQFTDAKRNHNVFCISTENEGPNGRETPDLGPSHTRDKTPLGFRMAQIMKANIYGEDIEYSGPEYKSMTVKDGKAILIFDHIGTGMIIDDGREKLYGFEISDDPSVDIYTEGEGFVPADAEIAGNTVIVSAPGITNPVSVRYCHVRIDEEIRSETGSATLGGNLSNNTKIPACPFIATLSDADFETIKITDTKGNEVALKDGIKDGIKLTINSKNEGLSAQDAKIIVAYYKNGILSDTEVIDSYFETRMGRSFTSKVIKDEAYLENDNCEIKLFLWNAKTVPLTQSISVK
ncbi:MAG: hypothetical protein E7391_00050 [Ruminococcaceae bacterium]|nr:hypothetical protein [Oscillospiraceae bacterium]